MQPIGKIAFFLLLLVSLASEAFITQEQLRIAHSKFSEPLVFNITLPTGYSENKDKSYVVMFNFHHYSNSYLTLATLLLHWVD